MHVTLLAYSIGQSIKLFERPCLSASVRPSKAVFIATNSTQLNRLS